MDIIATRYVDIQNMPTTVITVLDASHTDQTQATVQVDYAVFDQATGDQTIKSLTLSRNTVVSYRQELLVQKNRLDVYFANMNAFITDAQAAIDQWLIDNPPPEP